VYKFIDFVYNGYIWRFKMIKNTIISILIIILGILGSYTMAGAQWFLDFENGIAISGYNDVSIPRDTGTLFSLTDDLQSDSTYFFRVRLGYRLKSKHTFSIFAAPLSLEASGEVDKELKFFEETFPSNVPLRGTYTFNSFRLTYRYDFLRKEKWQVGIGFTAKIRDAAIKVEGNEKSSEKTNVGFVPLINFRVLWQIHKDWGLLLEGDAAWATQGRAEDILLALQYHLSEKLILKAGYRILEGGADVEEVYNFALIHFFVAGITIRF
jgi:hypothetical protein